MQIKIWGQPIDDDGTNYHIHIKKPIYGHCVALSSKIISEAIRCHRWLIVSCPGASETVNPWAWVEKSTKISKVYRDPSHPMTLYQAHIGASEPEKRQDNPQLTLI
jgi:hypothetical protein